MTNLREHLSKRALLPLVGVVLASGLGTVGAASAATATKTVTLKDIAFTPASLRVAKGTKVKFAFRDGTTVHNVTSLGSRRFTKIGNRSSGSATRTFTKAGTYRYECTLHPGMTGRIVVH